MDQKYKNLEALKINHAFLAERLQMLIEPTPWFMKEDEVTDYGIKTDNNEIVLCSEKPGDTKDQSFYKDEASVFFGIGNGAMLKAVCEKKEKDHMVIVYESQLDILEYALSLNDFSEWIENETLLFVINKDAEEFSALVAMIESGYMIQDWILFFERYVLLKPSVYGEIINKIQQVINQLRCNTGTVMSAGMMIAKNDIDNLPYVIKDRGISVFKDAFIGKLAVLVSTGPSLSRNIFLLKEVQDKVIIIAVGQALRILLAYGIKPDFICTVDFGEVNMTHYEGLTDSDVPLVALNRTYSPLLKAWKGAKFISASINPGAEKTLTGFLSDRGCLEQGGSVAHFMLSFALYIGCNPIMIIGQDLALTDGLSHDPNADSAGKIQIRDGFIEWKVDDPRSPTLNTQIHSMGQAVVVPGYFNEAVITNIGLASFISSFEDIIKRTAAGKTIINCTQGGARIPRTKQMALSTALEKYCGESIDKSIIDKNKYTREDWQEQITEAIKIAEAEKNNLVDLISECNLALGSNRLLQEQSERENFEALLKENETHSNKAHKLSEKNPLMRLAVYGASRLIQGRDLRVKGGLEHLSADKKDFETRIRRNKIILDAALAAAEDLLISYTRTIDNLKIIEFGGSLEEEKKENKLLSREEIETYLEAGNWARILTESRVWFPANDSLIKASELKDKSINDAKEKYKEHPKLIEYNELIYDAQELGRAEVKDYEKILELLNKAQELYPDKFEASWGKATVLHHLDRCDESLAEYEKLVQLYPNIPRLHFEKTLVLMKTDAIEGLKQMVIFLTEQGDFQYFWRNVAQLLEKMDTQKAVMAYAEYLKHFPDDAFTKMRYKKLLDSV